MDQAFGMNVFEATNYLFKEKSGHVFLKASMCLDKVKCFSVFGEVAGCVVNRVFKIFDRLTVPQYWQASSFTNRENIWVVQFLFCGPELGVERLLNHFLC